MFCGRCGTQNADSSAFCSECGAPLKSAAPVSPSVRPMRPSGMPTGNNNRKIGMIAVAAAAVVVLAVVLVIFVGGRSYKSTVNKFVKAAFSADGKTMLSLLPDEVVEAACEEENMTRREAIEYLSEEFEDGIGSITSYYDDWKCSCEILDTEDYSRRELRSLQEDYDDEFGIDVKDAKTVTVEIVVTADGDELYSETTDLVVIKIGRSWYIDMYWIF